MIGKESDGEGVVGRRGDPEKSGESGEGWVGLGEGVWVRSHTDLEVYRLTLIGQRNRKIGCRKDLQWKALCPDNQDSRMRRSQSAKPGRGIAQTWLPSSLHGRTSSFRGRSHKPEPGSFRRQMQLPLLPTKPNPVYHLQPDPRRRLVHVVRPTPGSSPHPRSPN